MPAEILVDQRPSISFSSIPGLLEHHAKRSSDALAILAPGRAPLSYGQLYKYIEKVGRTRRAMGIPRDVSAGLEEIFQTPVIEFYR
jgi:hypothetical protein